MGLNGINAPEKVDLFELWKRSEGPSTAPLGTPVIHQSAIGERFSSSRSTLWTNFSQLSPSDQGRFFSKLTSVWPFPWERRAVSWPIHASIIANSLTSSLIATRICADMILYEPKAKFFDVIRRTPKSPLVFGVYSSGVAFYMLHMSFITPKIFTEDDPCSSCTLSKGVLISLATGIALPLLSTPYIAYYVLLQREPKMKYPLITKSQEMLAIAFTGNKAARSLLPVLVPFQVAVAAISAYVLLWGRNRIFSTMDADPDLAKEVMTAAQVMEGPKEKIMKWLHNAPLLSGFVAEPAPENEKLR
ncbi:unnamed protein product, partial [Mesorhabditis belari]|uniref:Uncharacterized protein n=1 Tax=Mesorhabditis belari TaxID=2138241 RepID=A0AAF3J1L6_9BILA